MRILCLCLANMAVSRDIEMSFDSSEDDEAILLALLCKNKKKKKRKYWVHPLHSKQPENGTFVVTKDLINDPAKFQSFYRMMPDTFKLLMTIIGPHLQKKDTNFRLSISPEERLLITLRFLATGASFRAMSFHFLRGETTIGSIAYDTCLKLWDILWPTFMPVPTEQKWLDIAAQFYEVWQMPNCIGSLDGKHIRIRRPKHTGSSHFNYMGYFSIVLLASTDANGIFTTVSVGDYGRNSDGGVLRNSALGKLLRQNKLNIPKPRALPGEKVDFPFYFVADEAFPLADNIMKPYPARELSNEKRIFNGRLSRARKTVECAFGRLSSKFRVLHSRMGCDVNKAETVVKATCVLHNFIYSTEKAPESVEEASAPFGDPLHKYPRRGKTSAIHNRDTLMHFFLKPQNALPWQSSFCI